MASMAAHHAEWLSLMDASGPFLSVPVLKDVLPNGLDAHDPHVAAEVRAAIEQWADPELIDDGSSDSVEVHLAFVRFVLHEVLGFDDDVLRWDEETVEAQRVDVPHHGSLVPDAVVADWGEPLMLVSVYGPGVRVDELVPELGTATPQELMVEHLKATGLRVGLVTDGERWTLVSYQEGGNPGFATWWSSLWGEERITLQAFRTLLRQDRFLTLGEDETIAALLDRSAEDQREVTTKLGNQTLEAVEILIRTIDRIDQERGGDLLGAVEAEKGIAELYDAAVTVMMRLIFLFYAEENDLLPMSEPLYVERYAASSLRERLQASADEHGEEVLESTHDGWPRLLATWRAVYGGVEHGDMVLAPYGGSLFDPDRYPFLEGRQPGSSWAEDDADPLPIDNRTVLHLLNALQTLDEGGQRRKLSFRALDVEQIGHVYEGMLDHTAARADGWVLGLSGTGGKAPEVELDRLDGFDDDKALLEFLKERTGRGVTTNKKWMAGDEPGKAIDKFGTTWVAAFTDTDAEKRARGFARLIRPDSTGAPTAFQPGSVYVADSSHRGATGTHYTPRALTEEIVKHTLDPLVYIGPAEGRPEDEWELRIPEEILDLKICDPACGSGAFLVQACRYLADAVVESARAHERRSDAITDDEIINTRRQVAERCLHGADVNPMACEMAKLSLWLVTLSKDAPFSFLDHAIRNGDSLLGLHDLDQLIHFHVDPDRGRQLHEGSLFNVAELVEASVRTAADAIRQIQSLPGHDLQDVELKQRLDDESRRALSQLAAAADELIQLHLEAGDLGNYDTLVADRAVSLSDRLRPRSTDNGHSRSDRRLLHWPLEFPTVFIGRERPGFDAFVANPPFMGGQVISGTFGTEVRRFLVEVIAKGERGSADLVAYFFLRVAALTSSRGRLGLLATNTISQGDTREVGLDQLTSTFSISRAVRSRPWPGVASLEVALVWMGKQEWATPVLDERPVTAITTSLTERSRSAGTPRRLAGAGRCYQGAVILGDGFTMPATDAEELVRMEPKNGDVLFPYVNGKDVNSRPDQSGSRWVINFFDWPEERARAYKGCFERVERLVKPERLKKSYSPQAVERWWQYNRRSSDFLEVAAGLQRVVAIALTSSVVMPAILPADQVFANTLGLFPYDDDGHFGLLSSGFHWWWAVTHASTLETRIRYTPSDCFETFPQPDLSEAVAAAGRQLHEVRQAFMLDRNLGLTKTYNLVHDPDVGETDVAAIRQLQVELDIAVRDAYGWHDLELDHGFHDTDQGVRYTFGPSARVEVLDRLRELNFRRYVEEVEQGLHNVRHAEVVTDSDGTIRLVAD